MEKTVKEALVFSTALSRRFFRYNGSMAQVEVKKLEDFPQARFEVIVRSDMIKMHTVTLTREYYEKLTAGAVPAEELVEESFAFLLAREPSTSILSGFNLTEISQYFPEYEREMKDKFSSL